VLFERKKYFVACENNGQCVNGLCLMNEDGEGVCSCDVGFKGEYCHEKGNLIILKY